MVAPIIGNVVRRSWTGVMATDYVAPGAWCLFVHGFLQIFQPYGLQGDDRPRAFRHFVPKPVGLVYL